MSRSTACRRCFVIACGWRWRLQNELAAGATRSEFIVGYLEICLRRPVGISLLMLALLVSGALAFRFLPVASLPRVDYPTIVVTGALPGADPKVMASTVAAPLERRLGQIAGVTELTSTSLLGLSTIVIQFDINRS